MSVASGLAAEARTTEILEAAGQHDLSKLERLLKTYKFKECDAVDVQNSDGTCPLHAAVASRAQSQLNGESENKNEAAACDTVRLLLENGAIWNQLDKNNETPGCIAYRLNLLDLYELLVDAGVRAEIILNRLEGYEKLDDEDQDMQDEVVTNQNISDQVNGKTDEQDEDGAPALIDPTAIAVAEATDQLPTDVNSAEYLTSTLQLTRDKLLDGEKNGVMMAWESDIMKRSVDSLLPRAGLRILNIGAGMMIFDTLVQEHASKPEIHHIIEAHPDVLTNMENQGWDKKPNVTIHPGRWQDILPQLVADGQMFDAIYYDTFAESYADFKDFFTEYVLNLLESDGRWSFFNGMGADRQISYDVYQKVVEMDLFEAGFDVDWQEMDIPVLDDEWEGVKRKYWNVKNYRLPVCRFMD